MQEHILLRSESRVAVVGHGGTPHGRAGGTVHMRTVRHIKQRSGYMGVHATGETPNPARCAANMRNVMNMENQIPLISAIELPGRQNRILGL